LSEGYLVDCPAQGSRTLNTELLALRDRIRHELDDIEQIVALVLDAWTGAQNFPEQQAHFLNSLALNLHSFYNGLERIFEVISRRFDPTFPSGKNWHRSLLEQMGQEIPGARPAVLSPEALAALDEFLAFRHRVRNLYTFNLEAPLLYELVERLPVAWQTTRTDLRDFCELLEQVANEDPE